MIKEKSVSNKQGGGMQDDQITEAVDKLSKSTAATDDASNLTLAGNPPSSQDDQTQSAPSSDSAAPVEESPADPSASSPESSPDSTPPENESPTATAPDTNPVETPADSATDSSAADGSLDPIKKEALQKLEPLISEIDLNPDEKYRALMMIIQATDNKNLVNDAFQAADKIEDSKARAQALLSIVNEIEYFKSKEIASDQ
jgi:hypothetical protein